MASCQTPTQSLLYSPTSTGQRKKVRWKNSYVVIKTGRSLITYSHDLKQTLGKINLMYCQLRTAGWWETKKLLNTFSHPSSPGERRKRGENKAWLQSFSHDSSTSSPKIQWHRGVGSGGCYQSVTLHLYCSFLLTIFPYSTMVSPRAAGKPLLWHVEHPLPSFFADLGVHRSVSNFPLLLLSLPSILPFPHYMFSKRCH